MSAILGSVLSVSGGLICCGVLLFVLLVAVLIFFLVRQKPMQTSATPPTPQVQSIIESPTAASGASAPTGEEFKRPAPGDSPFPPGTVPAPSSVPGTPPAPGMPPAPTTPPAPPAPPASNG